MCAYFAIHEYYTFVKFYDIVFLYYAFIIFIFVICLILFLLYEPFFYDVFLTKQAFESGMVFGSEAAMRVTKSRQRIIKVKHRSVSL